MTKIAFLIITTSNKRDSWECMKDTYLYNLTLKTFLLTQDKEHEYIFYIGIDKKDRIFDNKKEQEEIIRISKVFSNLSFKFIQYDNNKIPKGHHTKMWNILFKEAYDEGYDYFYQCGDDISFKTSGWINDSIKMLESKNNVGLTGPINNNPSILTQSFVSRKHMEIFGWYFPEEILNWCCDDWYNYVYKPDFFYPLNNHFASNDGGAPRYDVNNDKNFLKQDTFRKNVANLRQEASELADKHKLLIQKYMKSN